MKLSIITINLNDKTGLEKTIQSVATQTVGASLNDYELIVIDGLSTDGSIDVIKKYESHIDCWISEKDTGIYNAMNKGIERAEGEYCYFLNAGDVLKSKDVLQQVFEGNPTESFICGNFTTEKEGVLKNESPYRERDWTFSLYDIYAGDLCHQAFFIRKDNFAKYGLYNENLKISSDWALFFEAIGIHNEQVLYKDIDIVVYNMEGLSSQIGGQFIREERKLIAEQLLSPYLFNRLETLYSLERNAYIIAIIQSKKWINNGFRAFCKIGRMLGFVRG